nr:reverse transcriptase domain-containing protein [Tanacetum cinerariifolium]
MTTYLRNKITNFLQKSNKTFNEAWERFKDLLHQCPHHGFSELHQLDTFYNALNSNDQDALDSATEGNFLDKIPRECLSIIKSKSKLRYSTSRVTDVRANINAPLLPSSSHSNSFDLQQIAASLKDKLEIRMNRFEKSVNEMKNYFITPPTPLKAFAENLYNKSSSSSSLPNNTILNPKGEAKVITTRSGTDLTRAVGTDLARAAGTDLARAAGTDLARAAGTKLSWEISRDSSKNTKFAKQPNVEILPKIGKINALSKPVTSNSVFTPQVSKGVNNAKVISLGMFRISPDKISREVKNVPNTVSTSSRTKPINVSQPNVIIKKNLNSDLNGLSSIGLDNTKTRRPQPRSNKKNDRDVISKVVCAKCKKCLIFVNHDKCVHNYVNGKNSRDKKQKAKVSFKEIQMTYQPKVSKPKNVGTHESLATPKPRNPRFLLRWSPTGKMFNPSGKLVAPSNSESHFDCSNGDNACTSNA